VIELFKLFKGIYDLTRVPHFHFNELSETPLGLGVTVTNLLNTIIITT